MRQVLAYVQKVFRLHDLATKVADSRYRRRIPVSSVILAWVYGFMTMVRSTEQLGRLLDRRRVQRVVGSGHISADVLARLLTRITNPESVREISYAVIRKAMRNKCWLSGSFAGRLVIAIDGTELFSSCYRKCSACSQRRLADGRIQYYHRAVVAKVVGEAPLILDFEPIAPREGEQAAALRLVCRIHEALPLKQVLVLVDAGYQSPRLMNKLTEFGWHWILPIKDQAPNLRKAIVALQGHKSPRDTSRAQQANVDSGLLTVITNGAGSGILTTTRTGYSHHRDRYRLRYDPREPHSSHQSLPEVMPTQATMVLRSQTLVHRKPGIPCAKAHLEPIASVCPSPSSHIADRDLSHHRTQPTCSVYNQTIYPLRPNTVGRSSTGFLELLALRAP